MFSFWAMFDPGHADYVGSPEGGYTRYYFGLILWAIYNLTIVIILINLCVAMMDSRMAKIIGDRESIWKFYRTDVWMIFIGDKSLPVPLNIVSFFLDKILELTGKKASSTYKMETTKYLLSFKSL